MGMRGEETCMRDVRTKRLQRSEKLSSGKGTDRQRIQKLRALELLPAHAEDEFDEFVALAASLTGCQFAFFTLVTEDVVWVKSSYHAETQRFSRRSSFCTHTIEQNDIFLVPDALEDPHFSQTSLHIDGAQVRFYVGIPIKAADGITIGTLCATKNKHLSSYRSNGQSPDAFFAHKFALSHSFRNIVGLSINPKLT